MNYPTGLRGITGGLVVVVLLAACSAEPPGERGRSPATSGGGEGARADLPEGAQAISLLGDTLHPPDLDSAFRATHEAELDSARADRVRNPEAVEPRIWIGRRQAYLGRYRDAIATYTSALSDHPTEPRLLRHRGHRWITVRELDRAVEDLSRAGELIEGTEDRVEADGLPNERGIPTSTLHFNIWYHLGLAHYLQGDFTEAVRAYAACLTASKHPDSVVATTYWYYLTLRHLGRTEEAREILVPVGPGMDLIESVPYYELLRVFQGERAVDSILDRSADGEMTLASATQAYGVGAYHLLEGRPERAFEIFRRIVEARDQWSAFGYIAAEAELVRNGEVGP